MFSFPRSHRPLHARPRARTRAAQAGWGAGGVVATIAVLVALAHLPMTSGAFTAVTSNAANSFAAASTWCTTPGSATTTVQNDAMLQESAPNANYGGVSPISVRARTGDNRRLLIRPSLPSIPAGCTIESAVLRLRVTTFRGGRTYEAYRAASNWSVGSVTWNNQPGVVGAPATAGTTNNYWEIDIGAQMAAIAAAGPGNNYGILIKDQTENTPATFTNSYDSLDGVEPGVVTYTWG